MGCATTCKLIQYFWNYTAWTLKREHWASYSHATSTKLTQPLQNSRNLYQTHATSTKLTKPLQNSRNWGPKSALYILVVSWVTERPRKALCPPNMKKHFEFHACLPFYGHFCCADQFFLLPNVDFFKLWIFPIFYDNFIISS